MAKEIKIILLPEGRVINASLLEKDIYTNPQGEQGKPSYKIELAFDSNDVRFAAEDGDPPSVEDELIDAAVEKWGSDAESDYLEGNIRDPLLNGDKLAAKREKKEKPGDAYKGKIVIRAHTIFNKHGEDAPGGIQVWNENVEEISAANREELYQGCYGKAAVTIGTYTDNNGDPALMFYLSAFQKTRDGERLMTPKDTSTLFEKVGRKKGDGKSKRRSRKG